MNCSASCLSNRRNSAELHFACVDGVDAALASMATRFSEVGRRLAPSPRQIEPSPPASGGAGRRSGSSGVETSLAPQMPRAAYPECVRARRPRPCTGHHATPRTVPFVARPPETPRLAQPSRHPSVPSQALRDRPSTRRGAGTVAPRPLVNPRRPVARRRLAGQHPEARVARLSVITPMRYRLRAEINQ